ncbi:MAG: flagellar filament capping protein FliD [Lachnospiraceae bacterium]|nr:flagellar filament capping protein FliD [Lachnospiraceae bacterium]
MAIRLTGLNSGLDTDSMVKELVSAYSTKKDKYVKARTKHEWKTAAWKATNTKVYSFYTSTLSKMRYSSGYNLRSASISDTAIASVKAASGATASTQSLEVTRLATSGYLTGGKVTDANGAKVSANTKLSELGITEGTLKINNTFVTLDGDTTLEGLASKLKGTSVSASFDATSQRFFVSSTESGADGEFTLTAGDEAGLAALQKLGLYSATDVNGDESAEVAYYKKMASANADDLISSRYEKAKYTTESYTKYIEGLAKSAKSNKESAESKLKKITADDYKWEDDYKTEEEYNKAKDELNDKIIKYTKELDDNNALLADSSKLEAAMNEANAKIKDTISGQVNGEIAAAQKIVNEGIYTNSADSARIVAQDAEIKLNGATFTGSTNSFSINGLTIDVKNTTQSAVTITTSVDTQGIYDKIRELLKGYNEMIGNIDEQYYAESAKGYEPLTDDEKEAMTDKQIEEWEDKVKKALLRKDGTLGSLSSALKNVFYSTSIEKDGVKYNIASFGISTGSYFTTEQKDRGKFHIDGDSEDTLTSSNSDKLMAAIANDPDTVMEYFQTLSQNLYDKLSDKMSATSLSSAFTIYNDKEMSSQYSEYNKKVSDWEEKLKNIEDSYYKKFSKMESALSKLQSQTSQLSSLFGN